MSQLFSSCCLGSVLLLVLCCWFCAVDGAATDTTTLNVLDNTNTVISSLDLSSAGEDIRSMALADFDGDSYCDIVACGSSCHVIFLTPLSQIGAKTALTIAAPAAATTAGLKFGYSVAAGDLAANTRSAILVGAPNVDPTVVSATNSGTAGDAYLMFLTSGQDAVATTKVMSAGANVPADIGASFGTAVAFELMNSDSTLDILISEPLYNSGVGRIHVLMMTSTGTVSAASAVAPLASVTITKMGLSLGMIGKVGSSTLGIQSSVEGNSLLAFSSTGTLTSVTLLVDTRFGSAFGGARKDLNNDGIPDLIIGGKSSAKQAFVAYLKSDGTISGAQLLDQTSNANFPIPAASATFGGLSVAMSSATDASFGVMNSATSALIFQPLTATTTKMLSTLYTCSPACATGSICLPNDATASTFACVALHVSGASTSCNYPVVCTATNNEYCDRWATSGSRNPGMITCGTGQATVAYTKETGVYGLQYLLPSTGSGSAANRSSISLLADNAIFTAARVDTNKDLVAGPFSQGFAVVDTSANVVNATFGGDKLTPSNSVRCVAYDASTQIYYVGGSFTGITGAATTTKGIAMTSGGGVFTFPTTSQAGVLTAATGGNLNINAIVVKSGTVFVGGEFQYKNKGGFGSFHDTYSWNDNPQIDSGTVLSMTMGPSNSVYIVGTSLCVTISSTQSCGGGVFAWSLDNSAWTVQSPLITGTVSFISSYNFMIFIAGTFTLNSNSEVAAVKINGQFVPLKFSDLSVHAIVACGV